VLIVTYHAIASPSSAVCCPPSRFEEDLVGLRDAGFTFLSLDDVADWLTGSRAVPARSIAVTFDDAYASVVDRALPILRRHRVPATVFAIGDRIGGDNQWPGQWSSIGRMPLADRAGLGELVSAGIDIGSHSTSHPVLTAMDEQSATREIVDSADRLEQALGTSVRHFAYPYGIRGPREIELARRRYRTAVNAAPRLVTRSTNAHDLWRIDAHDLPIALRLKILDPAGLAPYLAARQGLRRVRRAIERLTGRT
jgi:peptidoglycan/xylan/chitin deacetylase (PgdA/CDA1 family)